MKRSITTLLILILLPSLVMGQVVSNNSVDSSFATPTNMTDEQMDSAKDFVHAGIKDRTIKEGCEQKGMNNCREDESGLPLESIIGKMYALIFGGLVNAGKGPTLTKKTEGDKDQADYCMYAAITYEALGAMMQINLQGKANQSAQATGDHQLQALVNLKETHKARKKTATWQAALYGGIASCYGILAYTKSLELDWKYWAKLGGAITLTTLYLKKANKHANAANKVQKVIDSLPKAGDCNPWTGTSCFCKEISSKALYPMEYEEVCVLNKGNFDTPIIAMGCGAVVENKLQFDKECKCKETNTCFKANINAIVPNMNIGANFMNQANQGFDLLNNGEFDEGKVASYATGAAAMAQGLKPKNKVPTPKVNLTPEQQKLADALKPSLGANAALAAISPPAGPTSGYTDSPILSGAALNKLTPEMKEKVADAIKGNYKTGGGFKAITNSPMPEFTFPSLMGQETKPTNETEILSFAEQAVSKADVSNAPETPIFDIISNRYRRSGWGKLQENGK